MMKKIWIAVLMGIMVLSLSACSFKIGSAPDAGQYTAGDAEIKEPVENLEIDWAAGSVDLIPGDGDAIILKEEYTGELKEEQKMHWCLDGTTLKVRYDVSLGGSLGIKDKKLKVTVPATMKLKNLNIDVASAEVNAESVAAENTDVDTASGNVKMSFTEPLKDADFDAASGKVELDFKKAVERLNMDAASGNIMVKAQDTIGDVKISAASGDVTLGFGKSSGNMAFDTASGNVTLGIPENADLTIDIDTASGKFNSEIPFEINGDSYILGKGTSKINIDTASGDINVNKN